MGSYGVCVRRWGCCCCHDHAAGCSDRFGHPCRRDKSESVGKWKWDEGVDGYEKGENRNEGSWWWFDVEEE